MYEVNPNKNLRLESFIYVIAACVIFVGALLPYFKTGESTIILQLSLVLTDRHQSLGGFLNFFIMTMPLVYCFIVLVSIGWRAYPNTKPIHPYINLLGFLLLLPYTLIIIGIGLFNSVHQGIFLCSILLLFVFIGTVIIALIFYKQDTWQSIKIMALTRMFAGFVILIWFVILSLAVPGESYRGIIITLIGAGIFFIGGIIEYLLRATTIIKKLDLTPSSTPDTVEEVNQS